MTDHLAFTGGLPSSGSPASRHACSVSLSRQRCGADLHDGLKARCQMFRTAIFKGDRPAFNRNKSSAEVGVHRPGLHVARTDRITDVVGYGEERTGSAQLFQFGLYAFQPVGAQCERIDLHGTVIVHRTPQRPFRLAVIHDGGRGFLRFVCEDSMGADLRHRSITSAMDPHHCVTPAMSRGLESSASDLRGPGSAA